MPQVAITGWTMGCDTISAIKQLRERAPMPLNEAHSLVNRVLDREHVVVSVSSPDDAMALADALNGIGFIAVSIGVERLEPAAGR